MPTNIQANLTLNTAPALADFNKFASAISSKNFAQPLGRITGDATEFKKSLEAATARVTAFGLTAGAIYRVSQAIREGAKATLEVDKQLVELNTFLGQSTKQLEGFSQSLFKIAKNSAVPFEAASEAAKEFARQGLSANEILKRTESALTLARISGISYAQAVNGVTTALNSFSKEALQAEDIVNKLIAVDTRFAVSSAQLNEALTRVGSSAEESGISLDKLIATVTAAQQTTGRGGAVIGNALKTIFTRLQRPEVLNQLEQLGIAVKDQNGFLLDGIGVLKNYADATKNLSQIEKARTAELIGGIYQINQVNALIKDLSSSNSIYADALRTSSEATDEAKKKNEELNKSLSAILQKTKTSAQEAAASLGSSLLDPIVKLGSAAAETLLKFVNPNSDMLSKGENSGKEIGAAIAKGVGASLGRSLVVGGAPLLAATGGLLAVKMLKFGVSSVKELGKASGEIFASEKELAIQRRINDALKQSPSIIEDVRKRKIDLAGAEREVLRLIDEQNRSLLTQSRITGRVTSTVARAQKASRKGFKIFADGYVPEMNLEESQAISMGAVNPKAKVIQATIRGRTGPVVVNDQEKIIPNFAGTRETAIIPNYRNIEDVPRMSSGYVPNFAFSSMKSLASEDRKFVDPETYSYLRYKLSNDKKAIDLKFSKSELKGQGWQMFERLGKTAKRMGLPVRSSNLSSQANDVLDITDASLARSGKYGIEEVLKVAFPQLIHRQKGSSKNTSLSVNVDDGLNHSNNELSSKNIFSTVSGFASEKYKGNAKLLRNSIIDGSFDISNVETNFAGGRIPNFAQIKDYPTDRQILSRFRKGIDKGKYFSDFYDRYEKSNPLAGPDRELLNKIYASQSYGTDDSLVFETAIKIFKGVKSGETNFDSLLKPLGLSSGRKKILDKILSGKELETEKTGQYFKALSGDKNALAIDRNVINTALGRTLQKGESTSPQFRERLREIIRKEAARSKMDPRAIQAALFAGRSPKQASFESFEKGFSGIKSKGYIPNFAKVDPEKLIIGGKGRNLILTSAYDSLKADLDTSSQISGGISYGLKFPDRSYASTARSAGVDAMQVLHDYAKKQGGRAFYAPHVTSSAMSKYGTAAGGMNKRNIFFLQQLVSKNKKDFPRSFVQSVLSINPANASLTGTGSLYDEAVKHLTKKGLSAVAIGKKFREGAAGLHDPIVEKYASQNKYSVARVVSRVSDVGGSVAAPNSYHPLYSRSTYADNAISLSKGVDLPSEFERLTGVKISANKSDPKNTKYQPLASFLPFGMRFEPGDEISKMIGMAQGYIPNYAGLSDAIGREKTMSGLPASQIMAHFDRGGNPVAVTNTRDEPNGLKDIVPNFAAPKDLLKLLSKLGFGKNRSSFANPISAGVELFQGNLITGLIDQLAEAEKVPVGVSTAANVSAPAYYGLKNLGQGIFGKGSKSQRALSGVSGLGQLAYGGAMAFSGGEDLKNRINEKKYVESLDASRQKFQDLTENTTELSNTLSKLDAAYRDPRADPREISKLAKTREDLLSKVSQKNPELVSKLASESSIAGKIGILEENSREAQRIQSVKEQALKFSTKGITSGKEAPTQITDFFRSVINAGNKDLLKQDLSKATPANFADVLKKGGLDVQELSNAFKTDDLKKSFIDALKLTQSLNEITSRQERELAKISKPQIRAQQMAADSKEVRDEIRKSLEEQLPELASFAGTFSKRAGISASSEASLAVKKGQASMSFQNSLLSQLSDKEFTKGLPSQVQARLLGIESPGMAAGKELEAIKQLPGLSQLQVDGIEKLIGFNSEQTRSIKKAEAIANESKNIQLRFLALQEKLAFGGDIKTSINAQMRGESMAAGIRGPLTYQLGGLFGSRRTQVGGATDFITETMQKYPGLLQTKAGKEPADIKALKAELTGLNAMDMQKDLLKRAGMAGMMGMGQTAGLLRNKAFDQKYLLESAGLKASALFGGPEVPKEVQDAIGGYEKFGVQSTRQSKAEDAAVKMAEDAVVSLKQSVTDIATVQSQALVSAFESGLKSTFGEKGIIASVVNLTTSAVNSKGSQGETPNVPNFANPVNDAVTREKMALAKRGIMGVPNFAMASINLERSPDLANASNPHGFGVTNSIDEKNGLRSLGMRSSGYVPNYALFGDKVASAGLSAAKAGNLFVYDHDAQGFYRITASGRVGSEFIDKNSLPKGAKTISTQPYSTKYESGQSRGSNLLKITDPRLSKLDELNLSSIPRSKRLDPILNKLSKSGKLTPENLLSAINKISGGEPTLVKTAFGSSFAQGKGVFGRSGGVGLDDADEIIKRFQSGDAKGFFAQAKVDGPHYGEMRVHVAVDSNGRVKLLKGGSLLKIGGNASDITSKEGVAALAKAGLSKEASKVAREYKKAAESTAVKSIRELVAKKGIKNTFFGVDVGATTLESAQRAGVNSKEFYSGGRGRVGTVVFELNPSEAAGSSGYVRGGISQKLVDQTLGKQLGVMPPGFAPKGSSITKKIADAFTASAASQIAQQSPSYSYMPGANQVASASTSSGSSSYSYMPKQLNRIPEGFKFKSQEAINKIFGQELSKSRPLSMGGYGPAIGSQGSVSGGVTNSISEKYGPKAFKFLSKYGGKALGALGGATSIYGYYEGFKEAKQDKYAGAAKMFESTGGLALTGAGLAGAGLATTLALPLAVGALGYGAIKGVEATGLLDAMYGAGYNTVGLGAIGSKSIRGMTSKTAFSDDMIVTRKKELLKEINRYNSVAGNPLVSSEFQLSRSRDAQVRKDEQDLQQLKDRLDKESESARAGIASRAAGAGSAETSRLNAQSASEEAARSSSLRKTFLESFDKNAESAGYSTTQDKVNYLLGQEGQNGFGSFKSTDFSDPEFARSFNTYKQARERSAATATPETAEFRSIQSQARTAFSDDVLREAVARGVSAETVEEERARKQAAAQGAVPNFAAMSNNMMSSNEVYSRMRSAASPSAMTGYAGGHVPNFAAGDFTNAVTEALKNGMTSAFPNGGSSSSVSNSNVINIDGRTSIQNAPDEAMQGIISILFDKIPELKKLGPTALNFKR